MMPMPSAGVMRSLSMDYPFVVLRLTLLPLCGRRGGGSYAPAPWWTAVPLGGVDDELHALVLRQQRQPHLDRGRLVQTETVRADDVERLHRQSLALALLLLEHDRGATDRTLTEGEIDRLLRLELDAQRLADVS